MTITLMHDRHVSAPFDARLSLPEARNWLTSTSAFDRQLMRPLNIEQKAASWATSAIRSALVFCHIEAAHPQEAWPLQPSSPSDLDWLRLRRQEASLRIDEFPC